MGAVKQDALEHEETVGTLESLIDAYHGGAFYFSEWEGGFIEDLSADLEEPVENVFRRLSPAQWNKVRDIYEERVMSGLRRDAD